MTTPKVMYVADLDVSKLHFGPATTLSTRKSVPLHMSAENTTWKNRVSVQLCDDEDSPLTVAFGIVEPKDDEDPTRRNIMIRFDPVTHKDVIAKLQELDNHIMDVAAQRSKEWWKKEVTPDAIKHKYKPLVAWDEDRGLWTAKFKVIVPHPKPDPLKKYSNPTVVYRMNTEDGTLVQADASILTMGSEVVPCVSTMQVWFMGENQFGVSLRAESVLCKPTYQCAPYESMRTKRTYREIAPDDAASSSKVAKEDDDDGAAAM
jgi:hypothetical protein